MDATKTSKKAGKKLHHIKIGSTLVGHVNSLCVGLFVPYRVSDSVQGPAFESFAEAVAWI